MPRIRVMAVDGALNHSGWVVIDEKEKKDGTKYIASPKYGTIAVSKDSSLAFKLLSIKKEISDIIKTYKPDVIVFEDTYEGRNALTNSRLNNAKGVFVLTAYELTKKDPIYVEAGTARNCLGFKNNKQEPFNFFTEMFDLRLSFKKGNDITDAFTLAFWYLAYMKGECIAKNKKSKKRKS